MLLILSASQVLAEEALYCVDTAAVGFVWDRKGEAKPTEFSPERHNVKVVSDSERLITRIQGGPAAAKADQFNCTQDECRDVSGRHSSHYRLAILSRRLHARISVRRTAS
jgi:hypothetical protein